MECLYVCVFSNGHIKVGRSVDPMSRISAHQLRVSCLGIQLSEYTTIPCPMDVKASESALIDWCTENAAERFAQEWFAGLDYLKTVAEAQRIATTDKELEAASGWAAYLLLLTRAGYTQTRIAELIGCAQPSISGFVSGKSSSPSFRVGYGLLQIGRKCGIPDPVHLFPIQEPF